MVFTTEFILDKVNFQRAERELLRTQKVRKKRPVKYPVYAFPSPEHRKFYENLPQSIRKLFT